MERTYEINSYDFLFIIFTTDIPISDVLRGSNNGTIRYFSMGPLVKGGAVYQIGDGNEKDSKTYYGGGIKFTIDDDETFMSLIYGRNEAKIGSRWMADFSIPFFRLKSDATVKLLASADISARNIKDDDFRFGFDLTIPLDNLKGFLSPVLPSIGTIITKMRVNATAARSATRSGWLCGKRRKGF